MIGNNSAFDALVSSLGEPEATALRAWLRGRAGDQDGGWDPLTFLRDRERTSRPLARPVDDDPNAIRRIGVIGGGTAGYLTALALKARRPWLDVTVVESSSIPVIGVGESTVQSIVPFLHHYVGIDPVELYRRVQPTWKLGIRFDWGPDPAGFMAPFDWSANSVGMLGSLATQGNINAFTLQSLLMAADRTPVYRVDDRLVSLMPYLPFSYHLDNQPLVAFLTDLARGRGIGYVDAKIADVVLRGDEWVDHLRADDGRRLDFDFYVDCTGFRSMLLGTAMRTPFHSYADSLVNDSAVIGNVGHGGLLKPYTTASTMNAGWCWTIPTVPSDHLGYVYCSAAISDERAAEELAGRFPGVTAPEFVRFRTGRHARAWRGNVMAIGNSYAFVEPLQSSSLLMITLMVMMLTQTLPASWDDAGTRTAFNMSIAKKWDALRWFIAVHYRYNTRLDTPYWRDARANVEVSGIEPLVEAYVEGAPLQLRDAYTRGAVRAAVRTFYDLQAYDCVLAGQKLPARMMPMAEDVETWRERKRAADSLVTRALPQHEALAAYHEHPSLHKELIDGADSWTGPRQPIRLV
ncbi:tryptophan halogenase [Prauserella shujinwangii]|uniref:Tryptophan halogenase n=2 Tax=Prauserella shujinwangii TaxID=1453103 RepID=A0A2T0M3U8_9PSEU|nr:tryptophan halogenase [Prauserella shujinwangii]